jgi:hypothetical protein
MLDELVVTHPMKCSLFCTSTDVKHMSNDLVMNSLVATSSKITFINMFVIKITGLCVKLLRM